jgi:hypothetical protein
VYQPSEVRYFLLLLILLGYYDCAAQKRLVLIGNTAQLGAETDQFLAAVRNTVAFDSNTIVLYLGNTGDSAALRKEAAIIDNTEACAWFIPGYDEWARGGRAGYRTVQAWQRYLESLGNNRIKVYPADGCPGPVQIPLNSRAELMLMDTQWWLQDNDKPGIDCHCEHRTREEVLEAVEEAVMAEFGKLVIFASYHPMTNIGVHSGTFGIKQHIFPFTDSRKLSSLYLPLPLIGSIYPMLRSTLTSKQDMNNPHYKKMTETGIATTPGMYDALKEHSHTLFIAGQENSLQLLQEDGTFSLISGAASGGGRVRHTSRVRYAQREAGFSVVEVGENGSARTDFYKVKDGVARKSYSTSLYDNAEEKPFRDTSTAPMLSADSVRASANSCMNEAGAWRRFFNGKNYRKEWAEEVQMKVFYLDKEKSGLKIAAIGGGHESITLHMEDNAGKRWILRPVNKTFDKVIPKGFRHTFAHSIVDDLASGQHPYGALGVPAMLEPLGIPHAKPEMVFIPNDTALGIYRPVYANTVAQLEERVPVKEGRLVATDVMMHHIVDDVRCDLDQRSFFQARLVDFLIADFDRHYSQWTWGAKDSAGRKIFYAVPKDRDQAFYHNDGLVIGVARRGAYSFMTNFTPKIKSIVDAAMIGHPLDRFGLNQLDREDWEDALRDFKRKLDDSVLSKAAHGLPPEIFAIRGKEIARTLVTRRDILAARGIEYYKYLSRMVDVPGDNGDNTFKVSDGDAGTVKVQVYGVDSTGIRLLKYSRSFLPSETKEVRLYGLNGNDRFELSAKTRIKFRVVGGTGSDTFSVQGKVKTWLYDQSGERNTVLSDKHARRLFYSEAPYVKFPSKECFHNKLEFPKIAAGYNEDDGILVGAGIGYKTFSFQKRPYASYQLVAGTWALQSQAYMLKYRGTFNEVLRHYDIVVRADFADPALYYFFGYGNESPKDQTRPIAYYRARYDFISADVLVRKRFFNDSLISIGVGPSVYHYWNNNNQITGRQLEHPSTVGLDSADVFSVKSYGGGKLALALCNVDNESLPGHGIKWISELTVYGGLNSTASPFTSVVSNMSMYATLSRNSGVRAVVRVGGGHIFSEDFEYFQAMTLGGNNYLRGFRRNRFAGSSMLYNNVEISVRLCTFNAYLLKGDFGVMGFNDVGRVWMRNEKSVKWHDGYGGGLYMTPFNQFLVSVFMGFSSEEQMFYAGLGTKFGIL